MTERAYAAEPVLAFAGVPLPETWSEQLVAAAVESATNLPSTAYVRFRDPQHRLLAAARIKVGCALTVSVAAARHRTRTVVFDGEVTALETEVDADGSFTAVHAADRGHRLMRGRRVAAYVDSTVAEVAARAAARHGLRTGRVEADGTRVPHLAQPNLTDWELLAHLADQQGLHLTAEGAVLEMRRLPPATAAPGTGADRSPYVLQYGVNLLSLRAAVSSTRQVGEVEVRGWDAVAKAPVVGKAPATGSNRLRLGTTPGELAAAFGGQSGPGLLLVSGRPYTTARQVQAAARALADETAAGTGELEATVAGTPQLRAGVAVSVNGTGAPFSGQYVLTSCRHTFDGNHGYLTQVRVGALPPPVVPHPPPLCVAGVAVGVVTDIREPGQGQRGAVRLRLPWLSQDYVTDWVRTLQWGGTGGGGVISPEAGDEVLVGFEHGRLDRPYVLGGLYNGKDAPTDHALPLVDSGTGRVNRRSVASRAGDRLELLTAPKGGPQGVRLLSGDGKVTAHLDRAGTAVRLRAGGPGKTVRAELDGRGSTVTIDAGPDGTVVLKAGTVRVEAKKPGGGVVITGSRVCVESTGELSLKGATTRITGLPVKIN
ncbi:VgrG-related protein [Streptomyces cinnamoneus]|uniref:Type IV secretion protein Rhs n=1 Tax=Streptomyces cinnamoneus TaxID=53446 RepID=A0A918TFY2_STRCJ|nr:VgrG-related protein [Streptomyces cinnamoneus]GHC44379.1 type IV secretion protein Rhs [Streptomyces cinnamoneus]